MWLIIFALMGVMGIVSFVYLISRFRQFEILKRIAKGRKALSWLLAAVPVVAVAVSFYVFINSTTMIVVLIHLFVFWLLCDLAGFLIRKIRMHKDSVQNTSAQKNQMAHPKYNYTGIAALLITVLYLGAGWFFGHHIFEKDYTFSTTKDIGQESIRVVAIADSHLGITIDGEKFAVQMERIQQTHPDIVVIVGDFVDDDSDLEDMLAACDALGKLNTTYGVYFVYGNHDEGYYRYRNFTSEQMRTALAKNGVIILEDESVLIDDSFYLIGRKDRSMWNRSEAGALTDKLDSSKYMILLDHQPNDYASEAAASVDLVLSGHTHGGHIFPGGLVGLAMGANDSVYGVQKRGDTIFLVTSGMSGWAIPFKTGAISEYVVIDIVKE